MRRSYTCIVAAVLTIVLLALAGSGVSSVVDAATPTGGSGVMGIDLGSEFIKVAGVKSGTIDIVLNEQSHRKSHHWLGFRGDDRFFAEDAKNFAARFPTQMAGGFNRMVGVPFKETAWLADELYLHYNISERKVATADSPLAEDGAPIVEANFGPGGVKNKNNTYHVQEALGMMFHHLRGMAEKDLEQTTRDAVVVVPSFFTARQSQAIIDSAAIGGVKVITLLQSNTATGLMYGIQRRGFDKETYVVIYDMGATKTEVSLIQYSEAHNEDGTVKGNPKAPKIKLAHRMGTMKVIKHVSDPTLGGRVFDVCMSQMIEKLFVAKNPKLLGPLAESKKTLAAGKELTTATRKGLISLFRAANKAKEILGSNKFASLTVEGMVPDKDFSTQVTRSDFEQHCEPLFKRSTNVLQKLLDEGGVDKADIETVEMMGGAARIPKLLDDLGAVFGKPVDRRINSDEAAALGATYFAATLTESVRVKSFAVKDIFSRNISFTLSPKPGQQDADSATVNTRPLFINSPAPSRKSVTVARDEDFEMTVFDTDSAGKRHTDFSVKFNGVENALANSGYYVEGTETSTKDLVYPNNSHSIQVSLRASEANVVTIEKAMLTIKYATNVTKKVKLTEEELKAEEEAAAAAAAAGQEPEKKSETEDSDDSSSSSSDDNSNSNNGDEESSDNAGDKKEGDVSEEESEEEKSEENKDEDKKSDSDKKSEEKSKKEKEEDSKADSKDGKSSADSSKDGKKKDKYKSVKSVVMKKKVVNLKVDITYTEPKPFNNDAIASARALLKRLEGIDAEKRDLAASRNDLEAYLLFIRGEGFFENQNILDKVDSANRTIVKELMEKVAEWFDDSAEITFKGTFLTKLNELRTAVQAVLPEELKKAAVLKSSGDSKKKKKTDDEEDEVVNKKKKKSKKSSSAKKKAAAADKKKSSSKSGKSDSSKKSSSSSKKTEKKKPEADTTNEL